jgi:hypothetical protein
MPCLNYKEQKVIQWHAWYFDGDDYGKRARSRKQDAEHLAKTGFKKYLVYVENVLTPPS